MSGLDHYTKDLLERLLHLTVVPYRTEEGIEDGKFVTNITTCSRTIEKDSHVICAITHSDSVMWTPRGHRLILTDEQLRAMGKKVPVFRNMESMHVVPGQRH